LGDNIQQLYLERRQRIMDAVALKKPDRVPVSISFSYFPAKFTEEVTAKDAWYDFKKWKAASFKTLDYYEPDNAGFTTNNSGVVLEAIDNKTMVWPGHGVSVHHSHQFVEGEYMKEDEYDLFLNDMTDYLIRYHLPRTNGLLAPLSHLPAMTSLLGGLPYSTMAQPDFADMTIKLLSIAKDAVTWEKETAIMRKELLEKGYPSRGGTRGGLVPFDNISDMFRGMRGAMLDMYRRPEKLLAVIDKLSDLQIKNIKAAPPAREFTLVFIPLHRGADGFMSLKQFEIFYFPYLKKLVEALVEKGFTPNLFFEGDYTKRLEYLLELPKGKVLGLFDRSDMKKTKEVLGGHMCIMGNMPSSILQTGSVDEVKAACKWLIDTCGKDGGYIMAPGSSVDEVKPENLKAMIDFTKEYGKY
jgi:hypothetical protein